MEEDGEDVRDVQGRPSSVLPPGFAEQNLQCGTRVVCAPGDGASGSLLWAQRLGFTGSEPLGRGAAGCVAASTSCTPLATPDLWGQEKRSQAHSTPRPNMEGFAVDRSIADSARGLRPRSRQAAT